MILFRSIITKFATIFLFIFVGSLITVGLFVNGLNRLSHSAHSIIKTDIPTIQITQKMISAINRAVSSLDVTLLIEDFDDIDIIQYNEAQFQDSARIFHLYRNLLLWGSDSSIFKDIDGGILYNEWNKLPEKERFFVTPLSEEDRQQLVEVHLFFDILEDKVIQIFSLKKKELRMHLLNDVEQAEILEEELHKINAEILELKNKVISRMDNITNLQNDSEDILISTLIDFQNKIQNLRKIAIYPSIIIIFLLIASVFIINDTFLSPILLLRKSVHSVSKGNLNINIDEIKNKDEIGDFAHGFNYMVKKLKEFYDTLETRVDEKTKQLSSTLNTLKRKNISLKKKTIEIMKEKYNLANEKDKIKAILESIADAVVVINKSGNIIMYNNMATHILGFKVHEVLGKKYNEILKFVNEQNHTINNIFINDCINKGITEKILKHMMLITKNNTYLSVMVTASPLKDFTDNIIGAVIVFNDITKEREFEKSKNTFISLASHQLRTPLSAINWYNELLLSEDIGKINNEQKEYLKEMDYGIQRLVNIVSALLYVSEIETNTMVVKPHPTILPRIIKNILHKLSLQIKEKKINIKTQWSEKLPVAYVDPNFINVIFNNIILNSVKYNVLNGKIDISMKKQGLYILIKIHDTGYGISKRDQSKIFSKLFRGENIKDKDTDGTGVGLYIVKALVEKSKGKIWFTSIENKGTTFYITLPIYIKK